MYKQKLQDANFLTTNIRQKIEDAHAEYDNKYDHAIKRLVLETPEIQS